jgi:hypothetical protein
VAGHALTPATRHRLGRPSPHQQADRTRADPRPPELCPARHAVRRGYQALATVSRCYSCVWGTLPTCYSPVRRFQPEWLPIPVSSLDLHVLSTPPAFVLSQDQTLRRELNPLERSKHSTSIPEGIAEGSGALTGFIHFWVPNPKIRGSTSVKEPASRSPQHFDEGPLISDPPALAELRSNDRGCGFLGRHTIQFSRSLASRHKKSRPESGTGSHLQQPGPTIRSR